MNSRRKVKYAFVLFFLIFGMAAGADSGDIVVNGTANMQSMDFGGDKVYQLKGAWSFWWNTLILPGEFGGESIRSAERFSFMPKCWDENRENGNAFPPIGSATYRMEILLPDERQYGLFLYQMVSAYTLYINGVKVAVNGVVSEDPRLTVPEFRAQTVYFTPKNGRAELVLHISNKDYRNGGQWQALAIGRSETIERQSNRKLIAEMFLLGAILIIGIYNLAFFVFRKKDRSPLWFGLFCIVVACRIASTGHTALPVFFPGFPWELQVKLELSIFYLGALFSIHFVRSLFPKEFPAVPFKFLSVVYIGFTALALVTPVSFFNRLVSPLELFGMLGLLFILSSLTTAFFRNREYSLLFILGYLILAASAFNDLLHSWGYIATAYLFPFGLFLFIFNQAVVLARSFSRSFSQVAQLSERLAKINVSLGEKNLQLEDLTQNLEDKINERTKELLDAYDEIKSLALIDTLTGLANRRKILSLIEFEEKRNSREHLQYVIAMIDVDNFKRVNDTYGHEAGDVILKHMAVALCGIIREQDQACRWGGEEFLILFSATTMERVVVVAEKIRKTVESMVINYNGVVLQITVTIGLSISSPGTGYAECIKQADEALYRGKNEGKNRVVCD